MAETADNPTNSDTEQVQTTDESTPEIETYDGALPLRYPDIRYFPQFQDHIIHSGIGRHIRTPKIEAAEISPDKIQLALSDYCQRPGGLHALAYRAQII